jgi:mRNA interferase MazF
MGQCGRQRRIWKPLTVPPFSIVVVPFPYSDRLAEKRRPALVISHADMPDILGRIWVAMITSTPGIMLGDAAIADYADAGLPVASTLRASKIATLDAARVIRVLGHLTARDVAVARAALGACAGF